MCVSWDEFDVCIVCPNHHILSVDTWSAAPLIESSLTWSQQSNRMSSDDQHFRSTNATSSVATLPTLRSQPDWGPDSGLFAGHFSSLINPVCESADKQMCDGTAITSHWHHCTCKEYLINKSQINYLFKQQSCFAQKVLSVDLWYGTLLLCHLQLKLSQLP